MTFSVLSVIVLAGLVGPLLAAPRGWQLPVVLGELIAGAVLGNTGLRYLHPSEPVFSFLAQIGFALVMFVAGSHVPVRSAALRTAIRPGLMRMGLVVLAAGVGGALIEQWAHTGHLGLYAVLLASSSAALVLPTLTSLSLTGSSVNGLLVQVAVADTACIVALPLVIGPGHAVRAALGALAVLGAGGAVFLGLVVLERSGLRRRAHRASEAHRFAAELRVSLLLLFALAALAKATGVSVMLAGFVLGLAVAGVGEPRRLARQLFGIAEGFFGPLFFVWFGASLDLRDLGSHPRFIVLGVLLGLGACLTHVVVRIIGEPVGLGLLAAGQLGVPVAAATIGTASGLLRPGEASALMLGAILTIVASALGAATYARQAARGVPSDAAGSQPSDGQTPARGEQPR